MPEPRSEIRSLTGIRGIAALYVVLFHYLSGRPFTSPLSTFLNHGYLAVDLFFALSGFVLALNYSHLFATGLNWPNFLAFLGRRLARIYPLYLVLTLLALIAVAISLLQFPPHASLLPITE